MSSAAEKEAIRGILAGFGPNPVIVELGAHVGEEAEWIMPLCNAPRYIMVEPDGRNCARIKKRFPKALVLEAAITIDTGFHGFYPAYNTTSNNRASGSIKKPTGHLEYFPEVVFEEKIKVIATSLDHLCEHEKCIDLLWSDIQGAERDMIIGGRNTLAKTRYMMIEAEPEVELYEGQALKPELIAMLPDWVVLNDFGYNLLMWNSKCEK